MWRSKKVKTVICVRPKACKCAEQWNHLIRDGPLEKWWGRGGKKNHAREGDWKKKKKLKKKQSCLVNCTVRLTNCIRLKGNMAATLYCSINFLVLVESPLTWFSLLLGKRTFLPFKADTFCAQQLTSSWTLVAKHPDRKPFTDNRGLKVLKTETMCYKQPFCLIRMQLSKHMFWKPRHIGVISELTCITADCGHRCA